MNSWQDRFWLWLTVGVVAVLIWGASHYGYWYATSITGFGLALLIPSGRRSIMTASLGGLLGWGIPLAIESLSANLSGAASIVAGVMGMGKDSGTLLIIVTLLFGTILSFAGAWFGSSLRNMFAD